MPLRTQDFDDHCSVEEKLADIGLARNSRPHSDIHQRITMAQGIYWQLWLALLGGFLAKLDMCRIVLKKDFGKKFWKKVLTQRTGFKMAFSLR